MLVGTLAALPPGSGAVDVQVISSDPAAVGWRPKVLDYPTEPRATEALETLISSMEELLYRLPTASDSEMGRLRVRATNALAAAKAAAAANLARAAVDTEPVRTGYLVLRVREWPKTALAVAAMLGLFIGLWGGQFAQRRPRRLHTAPQRRTKFRCVSSHATRP